MLELMKVIKKQSDELQKLLNKPYGTKVLSRLEKPTNTGGDNVGEFPCHGIDNLPLVSEYDAINYFDVRV